ncbi:MAG: hypothetical protein LBI45_06340 [Bacteroidales bacterium]|jgi:hypothetical protein|nr:hypothetical protein [Bacteroidales bacterium]
MKNTFLYFLLLGAIIIPLFLLYEHEEKFPILIGIALGVTIAFWGALIVMKRKSKKQ